jgi:hypothetical protein
MAAALWGCTKLLPRWIQWALWPMYSAPDNNNKGMTAKWVLCTLLWMWFDTPVPVAYGLHLFANQFPQMEFALRHEGGGPSRILQRERYGWVCFVVMSFLLRLVEVSEMGARADLHFLGLPLWVWFLFIPNSPWNRSSSKEASSKSHIQGKARSGPKSNTPPPSSTPISFEGPADALRHGTRGFDVPSTIYSHIVSVGPSEREAAVHNDQRCTISNLQEPPCPFLSKT